MNPITIIVESILQQDISIITTHSTMAQNKKGNTPNNQIFVLLRGITLVFISSRYRHFFLFKRHVHTHN